MSSSEIAPTPKFLEAAEALIESVENLQNDPESLEVAAMRLRNMILAQRQWSRRAARRGPGSAGPGSKTLQEVLLERLLRAEERCRALLPRARCSTPQDR